MTAFTIPFIPFRKKEWDDDRVARAARTLLAMAQLRAWAELKPSFAAIRRLTAVDVQVRHDNIHCYADVTVEDSPWTRLAVQLAQAALLDPALDAAIGDAVHAVGLQLKLEATPILAIEHDRQPWIVEETRLIGIGGESFELADAPASLVAHVEDVRARGFGDDGLTELVEMDADAQVGLQALLVSERRADVEAALGRIGLVRRPSPATLSAVLDVARVVGCERLSRVVEGIAGRAATRPRGMAVLTEAVAGDQPDRAAAALAALVRMVGQARYATEDTDAIASITKTTAEDVRPWVLRALEEGTVAQQRVACRMLKRSSIAADGWEYVLAGIVRADRDATLVCDALRALLPFSWKRLREPDLEMIERALARHAVALGEDAKTLDTRLYLTRHGRG